MLVYEKWTEEEGESELVRHLYGTENNVPSDSDYQLVYLDEYGDGITLTDALKNQYFDDGKGGITIVTPDGVSSFLGVAVRDANRQIITIVPDGGFTPKEKEKS